MTARILIGLLLLTAAPAAVAGADAKDKPHLKILSGEPRTIVCITNSHGGGTKVLEKKLNRYFAERGVAKTPVTVNRANGWATPVDPQTGEVERGSWLEKFSLDEARKAGHPVIVIALSGVTMPKPAKKGEVVPVDDETIAVGVRRLQAFEKVLRAKGADDVFFSSYHYFGGASAPQHRAQYDPQYTMDVFGAFNNATDARHTIDCLLPTRARHAAVLGPDQFHPSPAGAAVYGHCWFEALLKHDGLEVPVWSAEEMEAAVKRQGEPNPPVEPVKKIQPD